MTLNTHGVPFKIHLEKAKNLKAADLNGKSDPYVILYCEGHTFKSKVKKATLSPEWDEKYEFNIQNTKSIMVFHFYDHDEYTKDDIIGELKITAKKVLDESGWFGITKKGEVKLSASYGESNV